MDARSPRPQGRLGSALVSLLCALLASCAVLLLGAIALHLGAGLSRSVALTLAVVCAALFALALPLTLDRLVTNAYRKLDPGAGSTWRQTALGWNGLLIAFAVLAAPKTSRAALEGQGGWLLGKTSVSGLRWLASHIPRSHATEPARQEAPAASAPPAPPSASALAAATAIEPPPAPAPTVPGQVQTPEQVFELRSPAVVVIAVRTAIDEGSPLAGLFGQLGIHNLPSSGSGFLVSEDGLLVTNHHVIDGASSAQVTLKDGRRFDQVTLELADAKRDLALLRIDGKGLPRVPLAGPEKVVPGARATAIGSPLGLEFSVTDGIISNTRKFSGTTFLQMQTPIAPGSSGGPLFDDRGRVIGVNTATKGAGMNLAVFVSHVHDLLAAPRSPRQLLRHPAEARINDVQVNGGDATPVDLMQMEEVLQALVLAAESCVHEVPADAYPSVFFAVEKVSGFPRGEPATTTNLREADLKCMGRTLELYGKMAALALVASYPTNISKGEVVELEFLLEGLPLAMEDAGAPTTRPIKVRFRVGRREK